MHILLIPAKKTRTHGFVDQEQQIRTTYQEGITKMIKQQGEVSGFNGKMVENLGITYEKC
jgi:hypothetical protein